MRLMVSGTSTPPSAAEQKLIVSAEPITSDSGMSRYQTHTIRPSRVPRVSPFIIATRTSFHSSVRALELPIWPSARPRIISVNTWVPALPPMPATIGISTASATICSIVPSKRPTTLAARNAVHRFTPSHTTRRRAEHVRGLVQARRGQRLVLGLVADDVDHVVDGDAAEQDVAVVDHRRADPVVVGELARHFLGGFLHVDRRLLVVDQLVDRRV